MGDVDLHIHTTASDGCHTPRQIVEMASALRLCAIAITDHDSTDGVAEARQASHELPLEVIPGVELSTDFSRVELHVLGYYIGTEGALQELLQRLRAGRVQRLQKMVDRLQAMGFPLDWEQVTSGVADQAAMGRPHIAQAMVERGYVRSVEEAFLFYLGRGRPAYVERFKLSPQEAIRVVRQAGGIPVLAHPLQLLDVVPDLVQAGLAGLEAYYTGYTEAETELLLELARKHRLLVTGGSDFHGISILPQARLGEVPVPCSVVEELRRAAQCMAGQATAEAGGTS